MIVQKMKGGTMIVALKTPEDAYVSIPSLNRKDGENYLNDDGSVASNFETRLVCADDKIHLVAVLNYETRGSEKKCRMVVVGTTDGEVIFDKEIQLAEGIIIAPLHHS